MGTACTRHKFLIYKLDTLIYPDESSDRILTVNQMNRIQEKVKDIVEVRPYRGLRDFVANAQETLENYCFTDDTSALMAKWIGVATTVSPQNGAALALAGYRGVGKSHFLAAFSSIVAFPELRSKVSDSHVAASAQGLLRRHYPLVNVRRGSKDSLIEELKDAVKISFGSELTFDEDSPRGILEKAVRNAGDLPVLVVIDTAVERGSRVARNDGALLGEVAEYAKSANVIVCVALDDDIAGADGSNAAIVRTFKIDYLDQEHLYKVVNTHIFPKNSQRESVITDIYQFFCKVVPNFRWSSQRFTSLYPLHPGIVEVAPYVRLYVHDFALLSFAAEAGERILGRPANSLIAFDEVFDKAEASLRKIDDLADAFAAYDRLNSEVVGKIPVIQRLQAKLILKALLLLSLNGRGASAEDICSCMLIFDENDPNRSIESVRGIISLFSETLPEDITTVADESGETLFSFRVRAKENINSALAEAVAAIDRSKAYEVVRSIMEDKFSDLNPSPLAENPACSVMDCVTTWRGGQRRGKVFWVDNEDSGAYISKKRPEDPVDWEVIVDLRENSDMQVDPDGVEARAIWRADRFTPEEIDSLLKHYILQTEEDVVAKYGEHVRASIHTHQLAAERIVERAMLLNGNFTVGGFDYNFTDEARAADTLSDLLSVMLEPMFETRFPLHPHFGERLGMAEVSKLVSDFYVGSRQNLEDVQRSARNFFFPLGLVRFVDGRYVPEALENLEKLPGVIEVSNLLSSAGDGSVSLSAIYSHLKRPPYGLVREAQHLILSALVAERKIEFVTSKGDRINSRSLDLKIIWDDIVGVAKPSDSGVSTKRLVAWAQTITGDSSIKAWTTSEDEAKLRASLKDWLDEWDKAALLEKMDKASGTEMTTTIWAEGSRLKKTFGAFAEDLRTSLAGGISIDGALARLSEVFLDDDGEYRRATHAATAIENYLFAVELRSTVMRFLSASEPTGDAKLEATREALVRSIERALKQPAEARNREVSYLWAQFHRGYSESYVAAHDGVLRSHDLQEKFDEILRTDIWWEFRHLSQITALRTVHWHNSMDLIRRLGQLDCSFDVTGAMAESPSCFCQFRLADAEKWHKLPDELWSEISRGQVSIRDMLRTRSKEIVERIDDLIGKTGVSKEIKVAAGELSRLLQSGSDIPRLNLEQLDLLRQVFDEVSNGSTAGDGYTEERAFKEESPKGHAGVFEPSENMILVEV
ncbi:MAG TPA: DUF6079 family protein [Pyrinomonadaceae bacterium]|nr:DUF6079 family protein [Pyrinomonadaceae bacterium]HMP65730.1 DUF6079 family protein [Pyrinomonadaceae bacterium]